MYNFDRPSGFLPLFSSNYMADYRERTNINHKGLQRTANEYAGDRRIYKAVIKT